MSNPKSKGGSSRPINQVIEQFRGLNLSTPWRWPSAPRTVLQSAAFLGVAVSIWMLLLSGVDDDLGLLAQKEQVLRSDVVMRLGRANSIGALREQKSRLEKQVRELEQQLPGRADMEALFTGINQAGLRNGLKFDTFKPGTESVSRYYAELPIAVQISGTYDAMGGFTADVAALPRIVTLQDLKMTAVPGAPTPAGQQADALSEDGRVVMTMVAKTYRYLDAAEAEAQRKLEMVAKRAKEAADAAKRGAEKAASTAKPAEGEEK